MGQSTALFTPVRRQSLADLVYQHIRGMILSGELASGADVNIRDLSKRLEVSTIPVREALVRLNADGLVTANRNHRATVVRFSKEEMLSALEYRILVEVSAARLACERIEDAQVEALRELSERIRALSASANDNVDGQLVDLNAEFHCGVAEAAGNSHVVEQVQRCSETMRVIHWLCVDFLRDHAGVVDHSAIVDALAARDTEAVAEAMRTSIEEARDLVLAAFSSRGDLVTT